jgi:hypothetical protein
MHGAPVDADAVPTPISAMNMFIFVEVPLPPLDVRSLSAETFCFLCVMKCLYVLCV